MFADTFLRLLRKSIIASTLLAIPLYAQTGLGVVTGTVHDATKAIVPNAKAVLSDTATGIERVTQSNADGIYGFENIPGGRSHRLMRAAGFKRWKGPLPVQAGQPASIAPAMETVWPACTVSVP